jgi:hypothetical protein
MIKYNLHHLELNKFYNKSNSYFEFKLTVSAKCNEI